MSSTVNLLFVYDFFYPAYRAGGPIQSLTNLIQVLQVKFGISVITGSNDHNALNILEGVVTNHWSQVLLPNSNLPVQVWYANAGDITKRSFTRCIKEIEPGVVYLNGIFSYRFVIIPLLAVNRAKIKIVLCPRGMLQSGALAGKSFKKKLYLAALKSSGLVKNITWHATNIEEEEDIKSIFGNRAHVIVAANIPKQPVVDIFPAKKIPGQLRLIYLSLIAEKKNLLQVIELINDSPANITLDIYGPVKDAAYWKKCEQVITGSNGKVKYMGDVRPELVQDTFSKYDASILLTKGENFGHALYESLSAGRPIITSYFTPWNELEQKKAGWNLDIGDNVLCLQKLEFICNMDNDTFNSYCQGAYETARSYYADSLDLANYHKLFTV